MFILYLQPKPKRGKCCMQLCGDWLERSPRVEQITQQKKKRFLTFVLGSSSDMIQLPIGTSVLQVEIFPDKTLWTCGYFHFKKGDCTLYISFNTPYLWKNNHMQLQLHCTDNAVKIPLLPLSFFFFFLQGKPVCVDGRPPSAHFRTDENVESPFGPQRHSSSMPQLYRKYSDMTARVITLLVEGTSNFWGHGKNKSERKGGEVFPSLLRPDDPPFYPLFWEIILFFLGQSEQIGDKNINGREIPQILLVLVTLFETCSSLVF